MKIVETVFKGHDWRSGEDNVDRCVVVSIHNYEGDLIYSVTIGEGEPEDMTLERDLSDVYSIYDLVRKAYELGREDVEVKFERNTEEY